ncbi:MAG: NADH-quinone oxidoreductase subunit M [Sphingomonadaceae bacterium]|uniref:NADH-quinone oxidoreductase subunit M n=1 Tax=Thermaurantiacus sp. TaxID=2820283 RepID=UPI00298F3204|nr:NADH-quinone oxidoreductase subunit M [Thermaurantiacus sp.]MCS6986682.1 NADH-quinone oxidoreductase subunit M [Sphingomonadaceae bacterium]MDW8414055.1 NADH-quinone oxidoreductase subunit M [Thermaurantiacus sp.]
MLSAMILLPLVGAAVVGLLGDAVRARWVALLTTLAVLGLALGLWAGFDTSTAAFQYVERAEPFGGLFSWHLGIDGIGLVLILLSAFLMPFAILAGWESVRERVPEYLAAFLVMEAFIIGVFAALDLILFYVFFEAGLIPMYLIIGVWGGKRRIYASYKFFLYTLLGSVLMLLAMIWMVREAGTTDIPALMAHDFPLSAQRWLWLGFFASFAVKMPMWPVHTWLPDAHVEAPTAGSMILAGVLLKMGGYGFLRFSLPMFPEASAEFVGLVFALSMVAVVYTSLVALAQEDMKKLIAYSSVAHMAFVTGGLFALNTQGLEGAMFVMVSHGLVSAALFFCVGVVYDRLHTREIARYGGLATNMPRYALFFLLFTLASIALPGTSGFVGEFLALMGIFSASSLAGVVMATGVILGAAYMLWLYARVAYGRIVHDDVRAMPDLKPREWAVMLPLAASVLWLGVNPGPVLAPVRAPVESLMARLVERGVVADASLSPARATGAG